MLVVSTYIEKSNIEGIGVVAGQKINQGDIVWFFDPNYDILLEEKEYEKMLSSLNEENRNIIKQYPYKRGNCYIFCQDNAKFFNHSDTPNCGGESVNYCVALKDIEIGEELTENYFDFDEEADLKLCQ